MANLSEESTPASIAYPSDDPTHIYNAFSPIFKNKRIIRVTCLKWPTLYSLTLNATRNLRQGKNTS
jgi:hypothetical protein